MQNSAKTLYFTLCSHCWHAHAHHSISLSLCFLFYIYIYFILYLFYFFIFNSFRFMFYIFHFRRDAGRRCSRREPTVWVAWLQMNGGGEGVCCYYLGVLLLLGPPPSSSSMGPQHRCSETFILKPFRTCGPHATTQRHATTPNRRICFKNNGFRRSKEIYDSRAGAQKPYF